MRQVVTHPRADVIKRAHQRIYQRLGWRAVAIGRRIGPSSPAMDVQYSTGSADEYSLGEMTIRARTAVRCTGHRRRGTRTTGTGGNRLATATNCGGAA